MNKAFEQGISADLFENSKMLVTPYSEVMKLQNTQVRLVRDQTNQAKTMEQAMLRHEKQLEDAANAKQKQMKDFQDNIEFEHKIDSITKEKNKRMGEELKDGLDMQIYVNK